MKKEGERWRRGDWNENDKGTYKTKKQMFHSCIATKKEGLPFSPFSTIGILWSPSQNQFFKRVKEFYYNLSIIIIKHFSIR